MVGEFRIKAAGDGAVVSSDTVNGNITIYHQMCNHPSVNHSTGNQRLYSGSNDDEKERRDTGPDNSVSEPTLLFVTRPEWQARSPKSELYDLELPSQRIIIAHTTGTGENSTNQQTCMAKVRSIQDYHMDHKELLFHDIGYNFLVGGDGSVYEGRGWNKQGAHKISFNECIHRNIRGYDPTSATINCCSSVN
ncbi:hypothetical protein HA402_006398 [Bradysia odoriphaga]|nr:hypothetical protein HA402_006398 [Bradysia odoriphaga]